MGFAPGIWEIEAERRGKQVMVAWGEIGGWRGSGGNVLEYKWSCTWGLGTESAQI